MAISNFRYGSCRILSTHFHVRCFLGPAPKTVPVLLPVCHETNKTGGRGRSDRGTLSRRENSLLGDESDRMASCEKRPRIYSRGCSRRVAFVMATNSSRGCRSRRLVADAFSSTTGIDELWEAFFCYCIGVSRQKVGFWKWFGRQFFSPLEIDVRIRDKAKNVFVGGVLRKSKFIGPVDILTTNVAKDS